MDRNVEAAETEDETLLEKGSNSPVASRYERRTAVSAPRVVVLVLVALLLGAALLFLARPASALTSRGATDALVNLGQLVRDASSAIPVVGFNMTSTNAADALDTIAIQFSGAGFNAGDDRDLRRLVVDSRVSGVGLYRDVGTTDDVLDAGDAPVTLDGIAWAGNTVTIDLSGHGEHLPSAVTGKYQWLIVIRTADVAGTLNNGDQIVATIPATGIRATNIDLAGFVTQPLTTVTANVLTLRLTRTVDMLGGTPQWIGPSTAMVNTMAVLGLSIIDGGIATNRGINDTIQSLVLTLTETGGAVSFVDFQPITPNGATSGIGVYLDTGTVDDAWDASDMPVTLASISPTNFGPGGATLTLVFQPPGLLVPDVNTGALDIFVVVRTAAISTGDSFNLQISAHDITVAGVLAPRAGTVDAALLTPLPLGSTVVPSSDVMGDATPPRLRALAWIESSPNLAAIGLDLYFNHAMTTVQFGAVTGQARDDDSGLALVSFSPEPSLASPPSAGLTGAGVWRSWAGPYGFDATSTDASSPAVVTVTDQVGNAMTTTAIGSDFRYHFTNQPILIVPNPGWIAPATPPFWVSPSGKLWFSSLIPGTMTSTVRVDLVSLFGGGLATATASAEPSLAGGPRPATVSYPPGTGAATLAVDYDFTAGSTGESSPVTISVTDNSGFTASMDFAYGLDAQGPTIAFLAPAQGAVLAGTVVVRANVVDALTRVETVEVEVDPGGGFAPMFFDGTNYFLPISTALYKDGSHRIIVRAVDVVGNENVVGIDVVFHNSAVDTTPPTLVVSAPSPYAYLTGTVGVNVTSTDAAGFGTTGGVWAQLGAYAPVVLSLSGGVWTGSLATLGVPDGSYTLTLWATDAAGNTARTSFPVTVDNTPPALAFLAPGANALVSGVLEVQVSALDAGGLASVALSTGSSSVTMAAMGGGTYAYPLDTTILTGGSVTLTVTATDFAGLATTKSVSVNVDNTPPSMTLGNPSSDRGAITLRATVSDSPAGIASVVFIVDGKTYTAVSDGSGAYSVTIWTTTADNGAHSYEVVATDRAGNTAMSSGTFAVNNPADYYAGLVAFAPLGIFLVLVVALILGLLLLFRRRKKPEISGMPRAEPEAKVSEEEI